MACKTCKHYNKEKGFCPVQYAPMPESSHCNRHREKDKNEDNSHTYESDSRPEKAD